MLFHETLTAIYPSSVGTILIATVPLPRVQTRSYGCMLEFCEENRWLHSEEEVGRYKPCRVDTKSLVNGISAESTLQYIESTAAMLMVIGSHMRLGAMERGAQVLPMKPKAPALEPPRQADEAPMTTLSRRVLKVLEERLRRDRERVDVLVLGPDNCTMLSLRDLARSTTPHIDAPAVAYGLECAGCALAEALEQYYAATGFME